MPLFSVKQTPAVKTSEVRIQTNNPFIQEGMFTASELPIAELIQRRRLQMLIHSYIYYELNDNLISDSQFDAWGRELAKLQREHPDIASRVCYAEAFKDWDGTTGFHLPRDAWVVRKAHQLISINHRTGKIATSWTPPSECKAETQKPKEVKKVEKQQPKLFRLTGR